MDRTPKRPLAPHVQAMLSAAAQPKRPGTAVPERAVAPKAPGAPAVAPPSKPVPRAPAPPPVHTPPAVAHGARPRPCALQRASDPRGELEARKQQFDVKLAALRKMPMQPEETDEEGRRVGQISLDEIAASVFSGLGSQATGAVALLDGKLFFAGQGGAANKNWGAISGAYAHLGTIAAADAAVPHPNMHAEMILVYYCLKKGVDPKKISAIGVKDKGCCRACAAVLKALGVAYTFSQQSPYELQWQDPWEHAGQASPFGKGSGLTADERRLL